jgi:hypothetical protein
MRLAARPVADKQLHNMLGDYMDRKFKQVSITVNDHLVEVFTSDRFEEPAVVLVDGQRVQEDVRL